MVVADDIVGASEGLAAVAAGVPSPRVVAGRANAGRKVAFVFPGQGSQWPGMARTLLETSAAFRARMEACDAAFSPYLGESLLGAVRGDPGAPSLERVEVVQPALFATMVSLAAVWQDLGVEPDAVIGHSQGEVAAAFVAGALTLEDAAAVVGRRSQAIARIEVGGAMAAIELAAERLEPAIGRAAGQLWMAAANGPSSCVVAGDADAIYALLRSLDADGVFARKIRVSYASHGPAVDPLREVLLDGLAGLRPRPSRVPLYSTVDDRAPELDADYWFRNLRRPVRFADAIRRSITDGHRSFVEVSPHPLLTGVVQAALEAAGASGAVV